MELDNKYSFPNSERICVFWGTSKQDHDTAIATVGQYINMLKKDKMTYDKFINACCSDISFVKSNLIIKDDNLYCKFVDCGYSYPANLLRSDKELGNFLAMIDSNRINLGNLLSIRDWMLVVDLDGNILLDELCEKYKHMSMKETSEEIYNAIMHGSYDYVVDCEEMLL